MLVICMFQSLASVELYIYMLVITLLHYVYSEINLKLPHKHVLKIRLGMRFVIYLIFFSYLVLTNKFLFTVCSVSLLIFCCHRNMIIMLKIWYCYCNTCIKSLPQQFVTVEKDFHVIYYITSASIIVLIFRFFLIICML